MRQRRRLEPGHGPLAPPIRAACVVSVRDSRVAAMVADRVWTLAWR